MDWETLRSAAVAFSWRQIAFFFLQLLFVYIAVPLFLTTSRETPIPYTIPIPEQIKEGWKGEVLENPSIKVRPLRPRFDLSQAHHTPTDAR